MTMFIKIEDGNPVGYPVVQENMYYLFPSFNFNRVITSDLIKDLGYAIYEFTQIPEVGKYEKRIEVTPVLNENNGIYYQNWQVIEMNDEEKAEQDTLQSIHMRRLRNNKLFECDYILMPDIVIDQEIRQQYIEYRQQLRDITSQPGFPWEVEWPVKPVF